MTKADLSTNGYCILDGFLSDEECEQILAAIAEYRARFPVPKIFRKAGGRPLNYSVIDGITIKQHLPQVHALLDRVQKLINDRSVASVASLADERVACNVNITAKHGTYRWHYDRNRYTALIYLNKVAGGETEMYPNYRLVLGRNVASRMQHFSDKLTGSRFIRNLFGKKLICSTAVGRLVIMRGDRCLHSVRPVMGDKDRINVILSFDVPGTTYKVADELNSYLYAETSESKADPNYSGKVG